MSEINILLIESRTSDSTNYVLIKQIGFNGLGFFSIFLPDYVLVYCHANMHLIATSIRTQKRYSHTLSLSRHSYIAVNKTVFDKIKEHGEGHLN